MKITKKSNLHKLIKRYPKAGEILVKDYGLHCVGCMAAAFETLEQGARAHGMDDAEIRKMVGELNKRLTK